MNEKELEIIKKNFIVIQSRLSKLEKWEKDHDRLHNKEIVELFSETTKWREKVKELEKNQKEGWENIKKLFYSLLDDIEKEIKKNNTAGVIT